MKISYEGIVAEILAFLWVYREQYVSWQEWQIINCGLSSNLIKCLKFVHDHNDFNFHMELRALIGISKYRLSNCRNAVGVRLFYSPCITQIMNNKTNHAASTVYYYYYYIKEITSYAIRTTYYSIFSAAETRSGQTLSYWRLNLIFPL